MTHDFVPFGSMDITQFLEDRKSLFMKSRGRKLSRLNQKESGNWEAPLEEESAQPT